MARIQISDLPQLADLSEEQLKELFGAGPRSFRPSFEGLEDRTLRSVFGSLLSTVPLPPVSSTVARRRCVTR